MKRKYDVILFDMDGTLVNTDELLAESMMKMYDLYREGKRSPKEKVYYFSGPPIRETLKIEFPNYPDQEFLYNEFQRISHGYYQPMLEKYDHSYEVIKKLKEDGFHIGVVTNKAHDLTLLALNIVNHQDLVEFVIASNDVKKCKPDPEGINKAIAYFNCRKERVLYVGDNASDLLTAMNTGVDCCLVKWGPRKLPKDIEPTFFISSYLELERHLYE